MRKSEIVAEFTSDIQKVWNIVTNNEDYKWRSDLERIEISDKGRTFIEYTKNGFQTKFIITKKIECSRYEFKMENKRLTGYWTGLFYQTETGGTKIIFTEHIYINNPIIEVLSYLFMNLKKIQVTYVNDLRKKLGEQ